MTLYLLHFIKLSKAVSEIGMCKCTFSLFDFVDRKAPFFRQNSCPAITDILNAEEVLRCVFNNPMCSLIWKAGFCL